MVGVGQIRILLAFYHLTMASQLLSHARRLALAGGASITGLATYKAQTDPVQLFWVRAVA